MPALDICHPQVVNALQKEVWKVSPHPFTIPNFRDAKQYWGLDDFMNVKPVAVTNAVNLAFLMVNLSAVMLKPYRDTQPDFSVLHLKAQFRARRYLDETRPSDNVS